METLDRLSEMQREIIEGFRRHLESDGKAARTVESYCGDVRNFLLHVAGQGRESVTKMSRADVTGFVAGLSGRGFRPATVNKAVNSLSCFEQYLKEARLLPDTARLVEPRRDRVRLAAGSEGEVSVLGQKKVVIRGLSLNILTYCLLIMSWGRLLKGTN
ncbi:MAG: phage integrase N-terminal SAM-like domain-containing protein [Bacillota bacterium]